MKFKKTHKIVAIVVVVIIIGFFVLNNRKNNSNEGRYTPENKSDLPSVGTSTNLKRGTTALEVLKVQESYNRYANSKGKSTIKEDGIFGSETEGAVKEITGSNSTTLAEFESIIKSK